MGEKCSCLVLMFLLAIFVDAFRYGAGVDLSIRIADMPNATPILNGSPISTTQKTPITFTCELTKPLGSNATVKWRQETMDLPSTIVDDTDVQVLSSLTITPSRADHHKNLECISTDGDVETESVSVMLLVEGPPDVAPITGDISVIENSKTNFGCTANNAFPAPTIQWKLIYGNNEEILDSDLEPKDTSSFRIKAISSLQYTPAREHNGAVLQCVVNHTTLPGPRIEEVLLNVRFCPKTLTLPCPESIMNGTDHSFACSSSEGNPTPNIVWRLDNKGFSDNIKNANSKTGAIYNGVLRTETHTRLITREDNGRTLDCRTTQMLQRTLDCSGLVETCVMNVLFRPVIYGLNHIEISEADNRDIECQADANPQATRKWHRILSRDMQYLTMNTLRIDNATKVHAGTYRCQAENNIGSMEQDLDVFVRYAPSKIKSQMKPSENDINGRGVTEADNVTLSCEVEGYPLIQITWYNPNGTVVQNNSRMAIQNNVTGTRFRPIVQSTLFITEVNMELDNGIYRCEANNTIGSENVMIPLPIIAAISSGGFSGAVVGVLVIVVIIVVVSLVIVSVVVVLRSKQKGKYSTSTNIEDTTPQREDAHRSVILELGRKKKIVPQNSYAENLPIVKSDKIKLTRTENSSLYANVTANFTFPRNNLTIVKELGHGAYGKVLLATAKGIMGITGETEVAVKTLKEEASASDREALLQELELMKKIKPHPNVVRLLGCCTETDPIYVIVEYMANGNLKIFLRKSRNQDKYAIYSNLHGISVTLTLNQLLMFARDTATGMDYLSSQKCIHRDLAARNVLLDKDLVCKVSDFGLARDVMDIRVYQKASEQFRLPVRWMAVENIADNVFTTESDVWSFGILLWEIITLGARPYPGVDTKDVINGLKAGMRMPCPSHCPSEIFDIMSSCWAENPSDRPSFSEICKKLQPLLEMDSMHGTMEAPEEKLYESTEIALTNEKL